MNGAPRVRRAGPEPGAKVSPRVFYGGAMTEAERLELSAAYEIEGLEHEIAALRVRLKTAIGEHPEDLALMAQGVGMLVKAVSAQYRLSPKARKDLAASIAAVLDSVGDQLLPADR